MDRIQVYKKTTKYLCHIMTVFMCCRYIPDIKLNIKEILLITMLSTISFVLLDIYSPSVQLTIKDLDKCINYKKD